MFPKSHPRTELRMRRQALDDALIRGQEAAIRETVISIRTFVEENVPHLLDKFDENFPLDPKPTLR